jgi:hypothetical protein
LRRKREERNREGREKYYKNKKGSNRKEMKTERN